MKPQYSNNFLRDVRFYLASRNVFTFHGGARLVFSKSKKPQFHYGKNGVDFLKAFHIIESLGLPVITRHPTTLERLLRTKAAVNLQIQQWAQGMAEKTLLPAEVSIREWQSRNPGKHIEPIESPEWSIVNGEPIPVYSSDDLETRLKLPEWVAVAIFNQSHTYNYAISGCLV